MAQKERGKVLFTEKGAFHRDIVDQDDPLGTSEVRFIVWGVVRPRGSIEKKKNGRWPYTVCDHPEALLSGSIPHLQFDRFVPQLNRADFEVNPDIKEKRKRNQKFSLRSKGDWGWSSFPPPSQDSLTQLS